MARPASRGRQNIAAAAINTLDTLVRDTVMLNKQNQLQQSNQAMNVMMQSEIENQRLYKQQMLEAGLSLDMLDQTSGMGELIELAGDSTRTQGMANALISLEDKNKQYEQILGDYNRGKKLAEELRYEEDSIYDSGEEGRGKYMLSSTELKDALDAGIITPEQAVNEAFMKGIQTSENEAFTLLRADQEIEKADLEIDMMENKQNLEDLQVGIQMHTEASATVASIIMDRLELGGINTSFFQDIAAGDQTVVDNKLEMFKELKDDIINKYPALAPEIIRAMNIYAAPESMAHTRHHGFIQMGVDQYDNKLRIAEIEGEYYNNATLRSQLNLNVEIAPSGKPFLDTDSADRLVKYLNRNNQPEYGTLVAKYREYSALDLHLDQGTLDRFNYILKQEDSIDQARMNIFDDTMGLDYDSSFTDVHPYSSEGWIKDQVDIADGIYNEASGYVEGVTESIDPNDPFSLNYEQLPTDLQQTVDAQSDVAEAELDYRDVFAQLLTIPGMESAIGSVNPEIQQKGFPSYKYIPSDEEILAMAESIQKQITNLNQVGKPSGPFGWGTQTEADVIDNQVEVNRILDIWSGFYYKYSELTGRKDVLYDLRYNKEIDPVEAVGNELTPEVLDTLFQE